MVDFNIIYMLKIHSASVSQTIRSSCGLNFGPLFWERFCLTVSLEMYGSSVI